MCSARRGVIVSLALTAVGCGYPVDPDFWIPDFGIDGDHGAIAFNPEEFRAALTARYLSQDEADSGALKLCGKGCEIVLRFEGDNLCGALASGTNHLVGVGSGKPQSLADSAAIDECRATGGTECEISLNGCNN
jgi:hypothetical protein